MESEEKRAERLLKKKAEDRKKAIKDGYAVKCPKCPAVLYGSKKQQIVRVARCNNCGYVAPEEVKYQAKYLNKNEVKG